MNRLPQFAPIQRLHGHLRGSLKTETAFLRRQNTRLNFSCLTASQSTPAGSPRCYGEIIASRGTHSVLEQQLCKKKNLNWYPQRSFSAVASPSTSDSTPLDGPEGAALLQGLDIHKVPAEDDGHPLAVYTVVGDKKIDDNEQQKQRTPVLLLHGRTWSSVPVYHLIGGENNESSKGGENRSLIQALYNTEHIQPYAMDFRGFGGTPKDESGFVEPLRCVSDVVSVLNWIHEKHNMEGSGSQRPALLGWSHGALIAQITAQRHSDVLSKLILYGSMYNSNMKYPISNPSGKSEPYNKGHTDHDDFPLHEMTSRNEYDGAMEDFTIGSDEARIFAPAKLFAQVALVCDPLKMQWWNLHELNECHPSLVKVPTMVIAGDQDPYAPMQTQAELFTNLGKGVDRVWSIIANADHAVHLSDERHRFVENVDNFLETRGW
ncbi:hypothetical protein ACHAXR_012473 [Thalassiosira sp. AJA248-18]